MEWRANDETTQDDASKEILESIKRHLPHPQMCFVISWNVYSNDFQVSRFLPSLDGAQMEINCRLENR